MAVKVKFDIIKQLEEINSSNVRKEAAQKLISEVKAFTAKGISPVKGGGKFARYKDPEKYPADKKPRRPVNLFLTGDMLNALTYWLTAKSFYIGYRAGKQHDKAEGNITGSSGAPARPFLPIEEGSELNISISRALRDIYFNAIQRILKKGSR